MGEHVEATQRVIAQRERALCRVCRGARRPGRRLSVRQQIPCAHRPSTLVGLSGSPALPPRLVFLLECSRRTNCCGVWSTDARLPCAVCSPTISAPQPRPPHAGRSKRGPRADIVGYRACGHRGITQGAVRPSPLGACCRRGPPCQRRHRKYRAWRRRAACRAGRAECRRKYRARYGCAVRRQACPPAPLLAGQGRE